MLDNQSRMMNNPSPVYSPPNFYDGLTNSSTFMFLDDRLRDVRKLTLREPMSIKVSKILSVAGCKKTPDFFKKYPTELRISMTASSSPAASFPGVTKNKRVRGIRAQITCHF
jgi:hypothetical protein